MAGGLALHCVRPKPAAKSATELRDGLVAMCQEGNHWCCDEEFLRLCGLEAAQLEAQLKKWWGHRNLWLDMFATEIGRGLGAKVALWQSLGGEWVQAVDSWLDHTYKCATANVSCPPARPMLATKVMPLVTKILQPLPGVEAAPRRPLVPASAGTSTCGFCGAAYAQKLGKCPTCFPASSRDSSGERVSPETRLAEWRTLPRAPIDGVNWAETSELLWCHGGSGGVLLVRLKAGAVCCKGCAPGELFAQRLATALGVRTAQVRLPSPFSDEHALLRQSARRVAPAAGENDFMQVLSILRAPFLAVIEFIDGFGMMGPPALQHLRQVEGAAPPWRELGRLMALDLLLNNYDRLPLAWGNAGNLGNVMLGSSAGPAVGIDQCAAPITHPEGLRAYLGRVRRAVAEARDGEGRAFGAVKEAILANTSVELTPEELASLRGGCLELATEVARLAKSGEMDQQLAGVVREVKDAFAEADGVSRTLESCCDLVRQVAGALREELA